MRLQWGVDVEPGKSHEGFRELFCCIGWVEKCVGEPMVHGIERGGCGVVVADLNGSGSPSGYQNPILVQDTGEEDEDVDTIASNSLSDGCIVHPDRATPHIGEVFVFVGEGIGFGHFRVEVDLE